MKKIIVEKTEGIAEVIDRILNEPDKDVAIVIPKGSALGRSVSNFHLLKREADSAGRNVIVESVDETILAFARESGLDSNHPLWRGVRTSGGGVSDIVARHEEPMPFPKKPSKKSKAGDDEDDFAYRGSKHENADEDADEDANDDADKDDRRADTSADEEAAEEEAAEEKFFSPSAIARKVRNTIPSRITSSSDDDEDEDDDDRPRGRGGKKLGAWVVAILVILGIGAYVASVYFNHANITINFKQTPYSYQGQITANKSASVDDLSNGTIAAQIFTANKNVTQSFPGSSVQQVSQKAQGTITIYNDYSTAPQELVATTRFLTPDGKLFRITTNVTVPGATQNSSGTLVPSSIDAPIVADQPGPDYNVGPVAKLTIPGFANSPQANGFYGTIASGTSGGFTGQRATPTAADIALAKASTTAILQASLQGGFSGSYPNNFKILDGATAIQVTTLTVNTSTDSNGNFTVFGQASLQAIGFDETALKNDLLAQAQSQEASSTFKDINLTYNNVQASFANGTVSFSLNAQGSLEPALSVADFEDTILGQSVTSARSTISMLPNLDSAEISVWPSWLWNIPSDAGKVHITVN